jgi:hypothetical protein
MFAATNQTKVMANNGDFTAEENRAVMKYRFPSGT